ncbi:MAG: hypothetical protein EYC70_04300 [Planctomycetota bacterium]|nr:MAG: hypothetical protein EYC70_04300 [Planctomycetota bacterium]
MVQGGRKRWAVLALAVAGAGCGRDAGSSLAQAPVQVEPLLLDLPRIPIGQTGHGEYRIRNVSGVQQVLTGIGPLPCDCASAELELPGRSAEERSVRVEPGGMQLALQPGEEAVLRFELRTARFREPVSRKSGAFLLRFRDRAPVRVEFAADIWNPHWVEPWALELGRVGVRQRASGYVMVRGHDEPEFGLIAPQTVDGWTLRVEHVSSSPDTYRINVTAPEELPQGGFRQDFVLRSDLPESPPIKFSVQGVAEPDIAWSPRRLLILAGERPRSVEMVLRTLPVDLVIAAPAAELSGEGADGLGVAVEPIEEGHSYRIRLTARAPVPDALQSGTLLLRTGVAEQPEIAVPYSILPAPARENP